MQPPPPQPPLTLLLASVRWAVHSLFNGLRDRGLPTLDVIAIEDAEHADAIARADVVAIDLAPDPASALRLCRDVRPRRATLPTLPFLFSHAAVDPRP